MNATIHSKQRIPSGSVDSKENPGIAPTMMQGIARAFIPITDIAKRSEDRAHRERLQKELHEKNKLNPSHHKKDTSKILHSRPKEAIEETSLQRLAGNIERGGSKLLHSAIESWNNFVHSAHNNLPQGVTSSPITIKEAINCIAEHTRDESKSGAERMNLLRNDFQKYRSLPLSDRKAIINGLYKFVEDHVGNIELARLGYQLKDYQTELEQMKKSFAS